MNSRLWSKPYSICAVCVSSFRLYFVPHWDKRLYCCDVQDDTFLLFGCFFFLSKTHADLLPHLQNDHHFHFLMILKSYTQTRSVCNAFKGAIKMLEWFINVCCKCAIDPVALNWCHQFNKILSTYKRVRPTGRPTDWYVRVTHFWNSGVFLCVCVLFIIKLFHRPF